MSKSFKVLAGALCLVAAAAAATPALARDDVFTGIGRAATPAELKAWDIDVRPDFKGLPKGHGSVDEGQAIWDAKCAACHGTFGESNKVFTPLIGGTTKEDQKTGHVAKLNGGYPDRTIFMKVATISTVWDYIHRAMPWNAPKSLSDNDVYAVLAYLLNLADIVPDNFVLTDQTIRDVQKILPNRNGMTTDHAMWPGNEFGHGATKPDTHNVACMKNCKPEAKIASALPDYAETSHGNLADQNRLFGPVRGRGTPSDASAQAASPGYKLAEASGCLNCHGLTNKLVGPGYNDVAAKYKGQDHEAALIQKIKDGGEGVWGDVPMPPQTEVKDDDVKTLVKWILAGAAK